MSQSRHKWSEKTRAPNGDSRKVCTREGCEIICVSRHRIAPNGQQDHYKEWFRGSSRIQIGGNTPLCEALATAPIETAEASA